MKERLKHLWRDKTAMLLIAITLLGLVLRVMGAHFGLPQTYHIDELAYVPDAVRYVSTLDLEPADWANPTLFKYLLALEYAIVYLIARVRGQIESLSAFETFFLNSPSVFYLLGRLTSAVFGAATIPVVYGIGKQAYGKPRGLMAAFLLALCFLHARDSHYAVSDVPMTFFFAAAVLCCLLYLQQRTSNYLYWAASLIGLAMATKYTALILVIVLMVIWAVAKYSGSWRDLVKALWSKEPFIAFSIMGLSFLVVCPYAVLDFGDFLGTLRAHYGMGKIGFAGYQIDPDGGWVFYLKTLAWGMGPTLIMVVLLSIGYALYRHRQADLFVLLPALLLYVYLGRQRAYFGRFIIPALPFLVILGSSFLWDVSVRLFHRSQQLAVGVFVVLAVLAVAPSAMAIVRHNILLVQTDTRTLAKQWIESHIPAGTKFFVEWHTPPLATESQPVPGSSRTYMVDSSFIIGLAEHSLEYYVNGGYEYLIASSFIYNIPRIDPEEDRSRRAFYQQLDVEAELVQAFKPYSGGEEPPFIFDQLYGPATSLSQFERPGPTIRVYELRR